MQEAKRFDGIDKAWKKIMQDTAKNPNVLEACSVDGRLDTLRMLSEQLETCQKSLSEYLDTKRCAFPRYELRPRPACQQHSDVMTSGPTLRLL